eukprot:4490048-Prymnesium_polylepis.1
MWGTGTHPEAMSGCCHNALDDASGWYKTFDILSFSSTSEVASNYGVSFSSLRTTGQLRVTCPAVTWWQENV